MLASGFPTLIAWGPEGTQLYNDACRAVLGATTSQAALGRRASPCWQEIRATLLDPMFQQVMSGGKPIWIEDLLLVVDRSGYFEEAYFTFSCSAIRDETGDPVGMLATFVETTARVLGERRLRLLGELAAQAFTARAVDAACHTVAGTLESHENDLPFFLLYLTDADGRRVRLCASAGVAPDSDASPRILELVDDERDVVWPVARVARTRQPEVCQDLRRVTGCLSGGPWAEAAHTAFAVPIAPSAEAPAIGVLVAGVSPRRPLDEDYRSFLQLVGAHIASALSSAQAHEAERERVEELAALDRAKTSFFTQLAEGFRAPLTSMLGPAGDLLAEAHGRLSGDQQEQVATLHANAVHLLRLTDALLDFLRIESGRIEPSFVRTDVAALTREAAAVFRSVTERAGLALRIECAPLEAAVYVDRALWEGIVLNLLSNALKFTLAGEIRVSLHAGSGQVELVVSDTGTGIAAADIPNLFRRFHRVPATQARTQEGSGLGLVLVHEFSRLHGGRVSVESEPGVGTSFTVCVPTGHAHLPADRIVRGRAAAPASGGAAALVEDAMRWLPAQSSKNDDSAPSVAAVPERAAPRILVADDHADIRNDLNRLLGDRWTVDSVDDGLAALEAVRARRPDLVIADVMMPGLDGLGFVRELRANPQTATIPVLLLSARVNEEARVEGLEAGAADYVSKPFSGRELAAKVQTHIELSRLRAQADRERARLRALFNEAPVPICILRGSDHVYEFANPPYAKLVGNRDVIGRSVRAALPELEGQGLLEALDRVYRTGETFWGIEMPVNFNAADRGAEVADDSYFTMVYQAMRGPGGDAEAIMVFALDVTDQVLARRKLEEHMVSRDAFFAAASHELRNPIHSLQLQLLAITRRVERERSAPELQWVHARLATAAKQLARLTGLVDTLLDVSRIASGRLPLVLEDVDLAEVVADAFERLDAGEQAQITTTLEAAVGQWDRLRLDQVVTNLVSNALKYGEGRPIEIAVAANADRARLEVTDHGIGIAPHHQERVFERFERAVTDRRYVGFGLGLWIASRIVEEFGGTLSLRSELGEGSTFIVDLPRRPDARPSSTNDTGPEFS
jgi:signal transduction histidine kinase